MTQAKIEALEGLVAIEWRAIELIKALAREEKEKAFIEAKLKAIKEFRASKEFENEIAEGSLVAYEYGFEACKRCLAWMLPKLDLSGLHPKDSDDEDKPILVDEVPTIKPVADEPATMPTIEDAAWDPTKEATDPTIESIPKDLD
ncbi:hypothetical protein COCNU_11G003420 [Cocos nucifera]|uniref:Uncharacterized protein n=1 Tax=Cocos nucifera TaxID=13894 RepID=A0A8K0N9Q7_COCNU|nr:hypothetical protein COCNU_11G003420 [Cocos nucifera]